MKRESYIEKIREFNRFYTVSLGMIGRNYQEGYSIAEARILYELRSTPGRTSGYFVQLLKLDKGYISRILKKFINDGILERQVSSEDARISRHYLTEKGIQEADRIIMETNVQIEEMLVNFSEQECEEICSAMNTIMTYFKQEAATGEEA